MTELVIRRAVPAVAVLVGALVALPAPTSAAVPEVGYSVTTAGAAVRVVSTQQPAFSIATGDLVDQTLGLVSSSFSASSSESRAASYYPGDLLAQAGQLICGQFGPCPVEPPAYPLLAEASWPTVRHATAGTSTASASATSNSGATSSTRRPSGVVTTGALTSATSTVVRQDGLHVHVVTTVQDVAIGPLAIASVQVSDDVVVHRDGRTTSVPQVVAGRVTVAGAPVELGSTPVPVLARRGLSVRLVGTDVAGARSGATGVRIDVSMPVKGAGAPVPGVPTLDRTYVGSVVLGEVAVVATRDDAFSLPVLPMPQPPGTSGPAVQQPVVGLPVTGTAPVGRSLPPVQVAQQPSTTLLVRSIQLDDLGDLGDLYAVLVLGAAVGLLTSRSLSRRAWS